MLNKNLVFAVALFVAMSTGRAMANDIYYECGISENIIEKIQSQLVALHVKPDKMSELERETFTA